MCDFSAAAARRRAAKKDDRLVTRSISVHTRGFTAIDDSTMAVCLLPGTELAFDKPVQVRMFDAKGLIGAPRTLPHTNARFRQLDKDNPNTHHDALEFPDGSTVKLTTLIEGQTATVFQLPAPARTPAEAKEQQRAAYV
jgi:hypothetical protein